MDDSKFWDIIEAGAREADGDSDWAAQKVQGKLAQLSAMEIQSFHTILFRKLDEAYSCNLWGAAYLINGGCSDDGFEYFRGWLLTRGRDVFYAALADPDSLAGVIDLESDGSHYECESLLYVADIAYEAVAKAKMPPPAHPRTRELRGESWDFDEKEETAIRLPRLSSVYR